MPTTNRAAQLTFRITATSGLHASAIVETRDAAREIAGQFPKSAGLRAGTLSTTLDSLRERTPDVAARVEHRADPREVTMEVGYVSITVKLAADGVNGGTNEYGLRRFRSFLRTCQRLGYATQYTTPYSNSLSAAEYQRLVE